METKLMTIKDVAEYLRLSEQTIQRYVLKREIPYLKIKRVIRFRPSDIERWAEHDGTSGAADRDKNLGGDLFAGIEGNAVEAEGTAVDGQAMEPVADETGEGKV